MRSNCLRNCVDVYDLTREGDDTVSIANLKYLVVVFFAVGVHFTGVDICIVARDVYVRIGKRDVDIVTELPFLRYY